MQEKEIQVDSMNTSFARVMEIFTWIGLITMVIFGLLYLFDLNSYVSVASVISHWGNSESKFWQETKGIRISGYLFLKHLNTVDCLSMVGVCILALAPLFSVVAALFRSKKIYTILLLILTVEFIFAIIRPLIMGGGG